ncbi:MAG: peptidoglycan DD-metalloendopeptidase family protein [bacterium]|nr:peptidoglycan DD-metalloendopeptidase family protein [bacterium]
MSRRSRLVAACLLVLLCTVPARAQDSADHQYLEDRIARDADLNRSRAELERLGTEQQAVGEQVSALRLSTAELDAEMARTAELVRLQEARLADIVARQALTADLHASAEESLARAEAAYAEQRTLATERLVNMYVYSTEHKTALSWNVSEVHDLENRHVLLTMVGEHDKGLLEGLSAAVAEIGRRREDLASLGRALTELARQESALLAESDRTRQRQAELHAELQSRIRELHSEIDALAAARAQVEAIVAERTAVIELEASERDRLRRICFDNPRRPLDSDGSWIDCPSVGVVIPPSAVRWPLNEPVTSEYGPRWGRMHEGIDIGGTVGAPIRAAESGRVVYAGWIGGYGSALVIDHGGGMTTLYGHIDAFAVSAGQTVPIGAVVGYVGNTGFSRGPHLHFEVRIDGVPVNPRKYLP